MPVQSASGPNRGRRIKNPLTSRTPDELDKDVRRFYERQQLDTAVDLDTLVKGARIARDPLNLSGIAVPGITAPERKAIEQEKDASFFQQSKQLKVTILTTACAAIIQGWQQSTINSTSNEYTGWLGEIGGDLEKNSLHTSLINAVPWLSASMFGTWLSDPIQEGRFGRRPALFVSAVFCAVCVIGSAHCNTPGSLLACRVLLGIGIGSKASIAPVFAAEAAVDRLRGRVLMMWQVFDTFGIFLGFACALIVRDSWRVLLASAMIPAVPLLFLVFVCPESPRFLVRRSQYADAFRSLRYLRGTDIQAARDLYYIHSQLQVEAEYTLASPSEPWYRAELYQQWVRSTNFFKRVWYLWTVPRNRRACVAACIVMASQQLCGMNVLSFYSSALFMNAAAGKVDSYDKFIPIWTKIKWFNFCYGFANFIFTLPAHWFIDTRGRRFLLLLSLGGMTVSLLAVSSFFYIRDPDVRLGLVASISIAIFTLFYSLGAGPIPFTLSAEVFPLALREVGMSFSVMVNFLGLGLLVLFVPSLTKAFGHGHACGIAGDGNSTANANGDGDRNYPCPGQANLLYLFTGLNVLALVLSFLFVPGTQRVTLEDMDGIFREKTSHHIKEHVSRHPRIWGWLPRAKQDDDTLMTGPMAGPMRHLDGIPSAV